LRQLVQLQSAAIFGLGKIHYNAYVSLFTLIFSVISIALTLLCWGLKVAAYASILNGVTFALCSAYFYKKARNEVFN